MARSEAEKRAQRNFMDKGTWKKQTMIMRIEDIDRIKKLAGDAGIPVGTWMKKAISAYSGESFSWDEKEDEHYDKTAGSVV